MHLVTSSKWKYTTLSLQGTISFSYCHYMRLVFVVVPIADIVGSHVENLFFPFYCFLQISCNFSGIPLHFLQLHWSFHLQMFSWKEIVSCIFVINWGVNIFKLPRQCIQCFSILWAMITSFTSKYSDTTTNMSYSSCIRYLRELVIF